MKNSLQYLNIKPSAQKTPSENELTDFKGQSVEAALKTLKADGFDAVVLGKGNQVVSQLPKPGTTSLDGEKVILQTDGNLTAPDMTGWSLRDVMKIVDMAGLKLNVNGKGYVASQSIKPNTKLHNGDTLTVDLVTPEDLYTEETKKQKDEQSKSKTGQQ